MRGLGIPVVLAVLSAACAAPALAQDGDGPRWPRIRLDAGIGYHAYGRMEEEACAGADACETDESAIAPFVQLELRPWPDVPIVLGAGFDVAAGLETRQTFDGTTNEIDLDVYSLQGTVGWDVLSTGSALGTLYAGIVQAWNRAVVRSVLGGDPLTGDRNESGPRFVGGGALGYRVGGSDYYGILAYRYATGGERDADTHHAIRVGIGYGGF